MTGTELLVGGVSASALSVVLWFALPAVGKAVSFFNGLTLPSGITDDEFRAMCEGRIEALDVEIRDLIAEVNGKQDRCTELQKEREVWKKRLG